MTTVAFIGLGNMGSGMADNLVKNDYNVLAFDLSEAALAKAKEAGCTIAQSTEQAAAEADIVITMLPAGKHVKDIYSNQILASVREGTLLIDCSTIDVETAKSVSE
ncbi:MAG: NAD(P)-binding domain-containing protein, partial [Alteromonas macleodii]|nr:NAD(P)-binding domain-containing protein [Alteromonas macleodii]MEE3221507.1 NAD(P)-binding domain-containing protein [Pseudomonadota bacterium]